jgi:hypothetical protein
MKRSMDDYLGYATCVAIILICLLTGCATTSSTAKQPAPRAPLVETTDISHFITFKAPPMEGVEVFAIDTISGKEVMSLGTTPVRVLILRKKLKFINGRVADVFDLQPTANALTYGTGLTGGVEFQFKFRKFGFSDGMVLIKIPFLMGDFEKTLEIVMKGQSQ